MQKIILKTSLFVIALSLTFASCKKDKKEDQDNEIGTASDNTISENIANDIVLIGNQALDNANNNLSTFRGIQSDNEAFSTTCASSITVDTSLKKVTVVFNNFMECADGSIRSGSLIFDYSQSTNNAKHFRSPGFKCSVTALNYQVDAYAITINSSVIQNTTPFGFNPATTNITWSIASDISMVKFDRTVTWNCTRYKTLLNTADTNVYRSDSLPIVWTKARIGLTGSANGVTGQGNNYTANITSQLIRDFTCSPYTFAHRHPFIQGVVEFTPQGKQMRRIDFGNGTCDNVATVTIGDYATSITLR